MYTQVKAKAPFILVVAAAFFVYQLFLFANSFGADYRLVQRLFSSAVNGDMHSIAWLSSELTGEVGVILRFIGACIFLVFAATLVARNTISFSLLRKSVMLEGIYYLFNLPFIIYLLTGSGGSTEILAALSYAGQMLLVTPIFLKLYLTLRKPDFEPLQTARMLAFAIIGFTFALWVKHFALALYALPPPSLENVVLLFGFVNSTITLLAAGVLMVLAFLPLLKKQNLRFSTGLFGAGLILMGVYVAVFLVVSVFAPAYWTWISLIDWWIIAMPILGISLLLKKGLKPIHRL